LLLEALGYEVGADFDIAAVGAAEAEQDRRPRLYFPNGYFAPLGNAVREIEQVGSHWRPAGEPGQGEGENQHRSALNH
jgi:hypothetical protein